MKLKRGHKRSDGMIFWRYCNRYNNGEYWVTEKTFERLKMKKAIRLKRKTIALKENGKKFKRGNIREDGMVFWGYHPDCKNGEKWMLAQEFEKRKLEKHKKILDAKKSRGIRRRGDIREDGMIFMYYSPSCVNGERWVTIEKFNAEKEKQRLASRKHYHKNPQKGREHTRKWRAKNPSAGRIYFQSNKNKIYSSRNDRIKKNPLFACRMAIHNNIKNSLQKMGFKKNTKTAKILGCSFEEFKAHIESQFLDGMSWDNRSEWHLDHIMPVSMAKTEDEIIRLNHYKNFRPLWAKDNLSKSNKTPDTLVLF
jgi:hypothetical protein